MVIYNNDDLNAHIPQNIGNKALAACLKASHAQPTQTTMITEFQHTQTPPTPSPPKKRDIKWMTF